MLSPVNVYFANSKMWVDLSDGRTLGIPLSWFPRLERATPRQRECYELSPCGIHWWILDEDISISGLIAGNGDMTKEGRLARVS